MVETTSIGGIAMCVYWIILQKIRKQQEIKHVHIVQLSIEGDMQFGITVYCKTVQTIKKQSRPKGRLYAHNILSFNIVFHVRSLSI